MLGRRSLYLHAGARVRGLKRDPVSYLRNPAGLSYEEVKSDYQEKIRQALRFKEHDIELSDPVLLQCFTHKSFAHGSRPYNEKLNLLGLQFLKLNASIHTVKGDGKVADFTQLGTLQSRGLISHHTAADYIIRKQLDPLVFWKMNDVNDGPINGKSKILSTVLNSVVGAIVLQQGPGKASQFVFEDLLNPNNADSLLNIASTKS
ncbi:Large ribosomal subunit protein mL57 [Nakaseomyces bracarensis]|uniref:Large ribosomal subunit protein mL57 n=1 Tax=Nakaseomyces bracarensis TaxID=273131 RepID=A0ABR4NTF8_9SACH